MNPEQIIIKNFEVFKTQAAKLSANEKLLKFLDTESERIMLAPASTRTDYPCCHPGGLVEHSLRVLQHTAKLRQVYGLSDAVPTNSLILCSLFHDIGKVGTDAKEYYVDNPSEWHRDKLGIMYNVADKFQHIPVSQLSLQRLVQCGVDIDIDEWYAISSISGGRVKDLPQDVPVNGEPWLAVLLQQAVKAASMIGKGKSKVLLIQ